MNKALAWIIVAVVVVVLLVLLAVLPARRGGEEFEAPEDFSGIGVATPFVLPSPTPEALTPEKEELTDLETETESLEFDSTLDADLQGLDVELRGV